MASLERLLNRQRNATKRYLEDFRREHPHLNVIVIEDALASNAPHIQELQKHDLRYILGAQPKDHKYLYQLVDEAVEAGDINELHVSDPDETGVPHCFRFLNTIPLNKSSEDSLQVNFLEYWQTDDAGNIQRRFAWVTDINLTRKNVSDIMRAGRARWRIENETFNTLKNQGYNRGHNYGLGKKHLWEDIRTFFNCYVAASMATILHCIVNGIPKQKVEIQWE